MMMHTGQRNLYPDSRQPSVTHPKLDPQPCPDCVTDTRSLPLKPHAHYTTLRPDAADQQLDPTRHDYVTPYTRLKSQRYCMKSTIVAQNKERTHVTFIRVPCKSWDCENCGPRKRTIWIQRLTAGKPEREITLTCPVGKFATPFAAAVAMKEAWRKLTAKIRHVWGPFQYALVFKLTKKGVPHIHVLCRGSYIAQKWLSSQWDKAGIGPVVYIQSVKGEKLHAAHACKYLAKSNGQSAKVLAPLRIIQLSSNYELSIAVPQLPERSPDMKWVWDRRCLEEIVGEFKKDPRFISRTDNADGSVEVEMRPRPVPEDLLNLPMFWVAYPGLAPIPDLEEPLPPGHFLRRLGAD
ncbi:hypothetical protein ES705_29169 [subsurface metagenome]